MNKRYFVAGYRIFFGLLATTAILTQFVRSVLVNGSSASNFFSFFTIESNLLAVALFLATGIALLNKATKTENAMLRGAVTLYMVMTGIIYALLLSGNEVALQTTVPWVNTVVHYIMPIVVLADWLVDWPDHSISIKRASLWMAFPAVYFVYSLIRGTIVDWYPYPFLDPRTQGYGRVALNSMVIAIAMFGLTIIIAALGRTRTRPRKT